MRGMMVPTRFLLLLGLACAAPGPAQPAGDPKEGGKAYRAYGCAECHGTTGAGGGWQGPQLTPKLWPYPAFQAQLRTPSGKMPPYRASVIDDAQVANIYAYLRSIPPGKRAADIPMLNR